MQWLLTIPKTRCFVIQKGKNMSIGNGDLECLTNDDDSLLMHIPGIFNYAINKSFPSLKASQYSFVFPGNNNVCFGVVFPIDAKLEDIEMFEGLLTQYSNFQIQEESENETEDNNETKNNTSIISDLKLNINDEDVEKTGKQISSGIKKGTEIASKSIQKGTQMAAQSIKKAKDYMKSKMETRENKHIDPKTIERIQKAKMASQVAVKVSKAIVVGAYSACNELAQSLADTASKTKFGQSIANDKSAKMEIAKDITKNTIKSAFIIYDELQNAALILVAEIADASADVVEYRYGQQMGLAAKETAGIVKDTSNVIKNVSNIGVTHIAASIVGTTIVDTLATDEEKTQMQKQTQNPMIDNNIKTAAMLAIVATTNDDNNNNNNNNNINNNNNVTKKD